MRYRHLRRRLLWHRRKLAAVCAAVAVFGALNVLAPTPAPTVVVVTLHHDVAAGSRLRADDLVVTRFPRAVAPEGAVSSLAQAVGRTLSSGATAGTPLTSANLTVGAWPALVDGGLAVPVRLQDPAVADLLKPGQHVRLLAVDPRNPSGSQPLVDDAVVLAVPKIERGSASTTGRLVVFEVPMEQAGLVTASAVSRYLSVAWGH